MKQRAARTVSFALAVAASAAVLAPPARAVPPAHGHDATRAALRALVDEGGLPGAVARAGRHPVGGRL
ncbi:hypothetical protein M4914_17320 [Streptomyces somaliensis DSM 40738]|uniref:Uncharacterized protein n=1 Tax=Streptomyces somaliensis (strain ATCC 33201 / DSM 40738 / JCM 12659 / KCTC 9044 / NCTC 11332 / NRRL B-12077 / IP 733) TaxID=1134445 RepID=A0AA44IBV0_STRE0|nr:hypothetical protein [Streptomyces somaliensis]MCQ0024544.1 hypothetical protein [Streptomyces somaliensis DSM 40738]NKY13014.1 hypothetical protein [Streptomyces somaliensis DSM 40738]